jgi:hypothetical protein
MVEEIVPDSEYFEKYGTLFYFRSNRNKACMFVGIFYVPFPEF